MIQWNLVGKVRGQGLVLEISGYFFKSVIKVVISLNLLLFTKVTKAAGQGRLSMFETVECSEIVIHRPYQLTLPAMY